MKSKRKPYIWFFTLAVLAMSSLVAQAQSGLRPRGDVNCDWEVTIADVNVLIDSIIGGANYHPFYGYAADVDGDKEYTISDINMVISAILGRELPPMPSYSGTLPVLYINTDGHHDIVSKEEYLHADWWLDAMGIEGYESIGSADAPLGTLIKGRGNATWIEKVKKPFRLKFDEKQGILGMPASRHWVLLANCDYWIGEINDVLPFEIGRRMGMAWNPRIEPVELVLNGQYIGLYFLTEKIRVAKDRVNIIEQNDMETNPELITGGWLLEIDNYKEPNRITLTMGDGRLLWITPQSPEDLSSVQRSYITDFLNKTNDAIYQPNKEDRTWENYIDIDSLAIFYMVNEIVDNIEAFSGSCFMHKQRGNDTKLIFGPMWDCGCTYYRWTPTYLFDDFIYENLPSFTAAKWIDEIVKFPHFQERVRYHWQQFYNSVYPLMDDFMDAFVAKIEDAGNCDFERWHRYGSEMITYRLNHYGKPAFHKKVAWLQTQWGDSIEVRSEQLEVRN